MLFSFLCSLLSLRAFALTVADPQLTQVDGQARTCQTLPESGATAFMPELGALQVNDDGLLALSLRLRFRSCVRDGDGVHWEARAPLDPVETRDAEGSPIRTEFYNPELVLADEIFSRLQVAPLTGSERQSAEFQFRPADFLSSAELANLAAGKPVRARLTVFYRAVGIQTDRQGSRNLGYLFGGSYTVVFTLSNSALAPVR